MSEILGRGGMPKILMVLGLVVILGIVWLLLKMKKTDEEGREEVADRPGTAAPVEEKAATEEPASQAVAEEGETKAKEKLPESSAEAQGATESHLPVLERPIEELPGVDREDFAKYAGKQVLVVEDNKINQKLILTLLGSSGIELETADDGQEALEKLCDPSKRYDLVLMDVNMPRMDGLEATREIRRDPKLAGIPVVALTASTSEEEVAKILESGMNAYLDKPIVLGKLLHVFVIFMDRYRRPQERGRRGDALRHVPTDSDVLDVEKGLAYSNEDVSLYSMLLEDFRESYGNSYEELRRLTEEKEYDTIAAIAVDLEGITGTLGAQKLHEQIHDIHRVVQQKTYGLLPDYLESYREELQRLLSEIDRFLSAR